MSKPTKGDLDWLGVECHSLTKVLSCSRLAQINSFMNSPCLFWNQLPFKRENGVEGPGLTKSLVMFSAARKTFIGSQQLLLRIQLVYFGSSYH